MFGRMLSNLFGSMMPAQRAAAARTRGNPLAEYFRTNRGRAIHKWHHYFEIYHRHFGRFRDHSPVVLEVGLYHGGSLEMWRHYFGPGAQIVGIDIDPRCREFADEDITVLIGDQADRAFLAQVRERFPRLDIVIDDGGHRMEQQIATFEELFAHVQPYGVYLCEDMHTSLWPEFGGGVRREGTFLEYSKALVDRLYAWYSKEPERLSVGPFTQSTHGIHFYDSVVVIEKRPISQPHHTATGKPAF